MTDIKKIVSGMIGQNFGNFDASKKVLDKKYKIIEQSGINQESDCATTEKLYYNKKGEHVATVRTENCFGAKTYSIWTPSAELLGRTYKTNENNNKFDYITVEGYTIKDNGNGIVDEGDKIVNLPYWTDDGAKTIKDLLEDK